MEEQVIDVVNDNQDGEVILGNEAADVLDENQNDEIIRDNHIENNNNNNNRINYVASRSYKTLGAKKYQVIEQGHRPSS